jgi:hypothetical protein
MAQDSQKAIEALEPKDQKIAKEFIGLINRDALTLYERSNQAKILDSSIHVRDLFDKHWRDITGDPYFSPITAKSVQQQATSTLHPKTVNYRVKRIFTALRWVKHVNEIPTGKGETRRLISFDVFGTLQGGKEIAIDRNIDTSQMASAFPAGIIQEIIRNSNKATELEGEIKLASPVEISIIGYWEVIFSPQSNRDDPEDVTLTHNGTCLQIKRNEKVILPGYYLEIADNATFPKFIQTPEVSRKIVAYVQFFPYTVLREATEEEYFAKKREGDRLTREARRRETELT